jgi:hypothetical protein
MRSPTNSSSGTPQRRAPTGQGIYPDAAENGSENRLTFFRVHVGARALCAVQGGELG